MKGNIWKNMRFYFRKVTASVIVLLVMISGTSATLALEEYTLTSPYTSYTYSPFDGTLLYGPAPYVPTFVIRGSDIGTDNFKNPQDIFVHEDTDRIYIADTGNSRVVSFSSEFNDPEIIKGYTEDDQFVSFISPSGVFVDPKGDLYVADNGMQAVVSLHPDRSLRKIYRQPDSEIYNSAVGFKATKVAVSTDGNLFIVCEGLFDGIVEIDASGRFLGYVGVNLVVPSLWEIFWRAVSTRDQRSSMSSFIPVDFNSVDIDENNFVYAVSQLDNNNSTAAVKRLNPGGEDVLRNSSTNLIIGDLSFMAIGQTIGSSLFTDIAVLNNGIYATADSKRSRIFFYDSFGVMLFAFGGSGSQTGNFTVISALDHCGNDLFILDSTKGAITFLQPTGYGQLLLSATNNFQSGDYDTAVEEYRAVLAMNSNCEIAYQGIGLAQVRNMEYADAMKSFRLANDRSNYSKAFKQYRKQLFDDWFILIFILISLLLIGASVRKPVKRLIASRSGSKDNAAIVKTSGLPDKIQHYLSSLDYAFYPIVRPFKGFWDLKREKEGTLSGALTIAALFSLIMLAKMVFSGYIFNYTNLNDLQPIRSIAISLMPILLFCVSNWCLTTLMDGEGSVIDIVISVSYALIPIILTQTLSIILSNILISDEGLYLIVIEFIGYLWTAGLILIGNLTIHNYGLGKAIGMIFLTIAGMAVIVFLALVFINLAYEMYNFIASIYYELVFR